MANRLANPNIQYLDSSGNVLGGGLLYSYVTGTTTPATTYSDATLSTANANPIVLDSAGRAGAVFLDPAVTFKFVLKTSAGVTIWTADPVTDPAANVTAAFTAFAGNPNGFVAGNAGSVGGSGVSAVYDITNDVLYFCTTTGDAGAAVWTAQSAGSAALNAANTFTEAQTIRITDAGASITAMLIFDWESATPAASDAAVLFKAMGEDSAGNDQDYTQDGFRITDPTSASEDAERLFGVVTAGTMAYELVLSGAALYPETSDGLSLGKTGNLFSDIYLASGAVINWNASDVTLIHSANALTFAGATTYTFDGTLAGAAGTFSSTLGVTGVLSALSTLELGHASDTTLARASAGQVTIEGNVIYRAGGTDVAVADGGTGRSTAELGYKELANGVASSPFTIAPSVDRITVRDATDATFGAFGVAEILQYMLNDLGTTAGNIVYYNGTDWVALAPPGGTSTLSWQLIGANQILVAT